MNVNLTVMGGKPLMLDHYELRGFGINKFKKNPPVAPGKTITFKANQ